jgi:hypothetical protein
VAERREIASLREGVWVSAQLSLSAMSVRTGGAPQHAISNPLDSSETLVKSCNGAELAVLAQVSSKAARPTFLRHGARTCPGTTCFISGGQARVAELELGSRLGQARRRTAKEQNGRHGRSQLRLRRSGSSTRRACARARRTCRARNVLSRSYAFARVEAKRGGVQNRIDTSLAASSPRRSSYRKQGMRMRGTHAREPLGRRRGVGLRECELQN